MTPVMLQHDDCREALRRMEAGLYPVCVADPPYGDTSLDWDSCVDGWLDEVSRVLMPNASIWIFGSMRFLAPLFSQMEALGFKYSQDIVWEKQNGTGFHNDRFRRVHEHAVLFYRGAWGDVFHDTQHTNDATAKTVRRKTRAAHWGDIDKGHYVSEDGGPKLMRSVLYCPNEHGGAVHPTQKPVEICLALVRYSTPPGGIVLDPFMGSASVGMASRIAGRGYVGIEKRGDYFDIAQRRMDGPLETVACSQSVLFGEAA